MNRSFGAFLLLQLVLLSHPNSISALLQSGNPNETNGVVRPRIFHGQSTPFVGRTVGRPFAPPPPPMTRPIGTKLGMADRAFEKKTKKKVQTIIKEDTEQDEEKKKEEKWRVVLHNDEVHTFNYVIRTLCKTIGTLDRKAAFEVCVKTHGHGKSTVTTTYKRQAKQFCLSLQRLGLTVSIAPDKDFAGGHSGQQNRAS